MFLKSFANVQFVQGLALALHKAMHQLKANEIKACGSFVHVVHGYRAGACVNVFNSRLIGLPIINNNLSHALVKSHAQHAQRFLNIFFNALCLCMALTLPCTICTSAQTHKDMS